MKREWEKPELIVLVRSMPEEMLGQGCKTPHMPGGPQNTTGGLCTQLATTGNQSCGNCASRDGGAS